MDQESKFLVLVLMTDSFFFCSFVLFFKFPEPIIFPFLSFSFTQGRVLLVLDYLKGYYSNQSIISEMLKPSEDEIHGHFYCNCY